MGLNRTGKAKYALHFDKYGFRVRLEKKLMYAIAVCLSLAESVIFNFIH